MTNAYVIAWNIGQLMAAKGRTRRLLSREQIYRLVTSTPSRLNLEVLAAFCEILDCTPNDLITFTRATAAAPAERTASGETAGLQPIDELRPVPARIRRPGE